VVGFGVNVMMFLKRFLIDKQTRALMLMVVRLWTRRGSSQKIWWNG